MVSRGGCRRRRPVTLPDHVHSARGDAVLPDEDVVDSDNTGHFCLSLPEATASRVIELEFAGTQYFRTPSQLTVTVDARRRS